MSKTKPAQSVRILDRVINGVVMSPWLWGTAVTFAFYAALPFVPIYQESIAHYFTAHWIEYATTGLFFIGMQVYEFSHFVREGLGYSTNLFGSTFFTLTGFHGAHVTLGVIWLSTMLVLAVRGKLPPEKSLNLEMAALYWHFVDVVWIALFTTIYILR